MKLFNRQGHPVNLGEELGRGGEGKVYAIAGQADLAAKVYDRTVPEAKTEKLAMMVSLATERLSKLTAWPSDTLHEAPGGPIVGFLMPRVSAHQPAHSLYGPKDRLRNFPQADWRFLVHTANNLARAFAVIHERGHVIGDVNHGNVVVSPQGMVRLIDCDSFQIKKPGDGQTGWFLCEVGVSTHTPPELQFKPLGETARAADHDNFGLAVLIFQLLFMGRHPFSGKFLGAGEMSLERAIQEHRFAYSQQSAARQMEPPPGTLPLAAVSGPVAQLFERAFFEAAGNKSRPLPAEWSAALDQLAKSLVKCKTYAGHYFLNSLAECPWCGIEARTGLLLFPLPAMQAATGRFDLKTIWAQIQAVPLPGALPLLAMPEPNASPQGFRMRRRLKINALLSGAFLIASSVGLWYLKVGRCAKVGLMAVLLYLCLKILTAGLANAREKLRKHYREAAARWNSLELTWKAEAGTERFQNRKRELERMRSEYEKLPALRQQKLRQLEKDRRANQFQRFLDGYLIRDANIMGIGATRKTMLQSYGIETAADITPYAVLGVAGFGPAYTNRLMEWRRQIEKGFVFDPAKPVDLRDVARVEQEISAARSRLEQELSRGATQLHQIRQQIQARRQALQPAVESALKTLAQLEADKSLM